jgi:hypothetical protein
MSDRPTPETNEWNAAWLKADDFDGETPAFPMDFARRLERERDEARELARELRDALTKASVSYTYSDEWQNHARRALAKAREVLP